MVEENHLIVSEEEAGQRLDVWLASHWEQHSRTTFQKLIEQGNVLVNGCQIKKRNLVQAGDEIEIAFILKNDFQVVPEDIPLDVVFEDEYLLVINKPAGLCVHPGAGNLQGTLVNALAFYYNLHHLIPDSIRPGIVHRLDKDTSGIMVIAKDIMTHANLVEQFASRNVKKTYLAVTVGSPNKLFCDEPISRDRSNRQKMTVGQGGKTALTRFKILGHKQSIFCVAAYPETGRTHQIRVHLKALGAPIYNDPIYGPKTSQGSSGAQMLHAYKLSFMHPVTKQPVTFTAPLRTQMQAYFKDIDLESV